VTRSENSELLCVYLGQDESAAFYLKRISSGLIRWRRRPGAPGCAFLSGPVGTKTRPPAVKDLVTLFLDTFVQLGQRSACWYYSSCSMRNRTNPLAL